MKEVDECTLEFSTTVSLDRDGTETLPQDVLADIGGDEEGDARSESYYDLAQPLLPYPF